MYRIQNVGMGWYPVWAIMLGDKDIYRADSLMDAERWIANELCCVALGMD